MIQLDNSIQPEPEALARLAAFQQEIVVEFRERSTKAKKAWDSKKKSKPPFPAIKLALATMCSGAQRCVYCGDSVADEIEHIYPKDLFPDRAFAWENYVYACGPCNGPKNNKFALFAHHNGQFVDLNQPPYSEGMEPLPGDPVLLNPRVDDPLAIAVLDLAGSFIFRMLPGLLPRDQHRFTYTYDTVLRLNERETLRQGREKAYEDYKSRMLRYVNAKQGGAADEALDKLIHGIRTKQHPTVWREMQRWCRNGWLNKSDPDLDACFKACPEALTW